jgi:undecaprenyl-diphosphatase
MLDLPLKAVTSALMEAPDLDSSLLMFFNSFAHRSWLLDRFVNFLSGNELAKGLPAVAVLLFAWFQLADTESSMELTEKRLILLHTLIIAIPTVLTARLLAWGLPFRDRPIHVATLHLRMAYTLNSDTLLNWSSFPSDHAALFFALATGVILVHRNAGLLLYAHSILAISLPRIYLGIHYPSDILAGALLGIGFGYSAAFPALRCLVARPASRLIYLSPGFFYAVFFFLLHETAELYEPLRIATIEILHVVKLYLHGS